MTNNLPTFDELTESEMDCTYLLIKEISLSPEGRSFSSLKSPQLFSDQEATRQLDYLQKLNLISQNEQLNWQPTPIGIAYVKMADFDMLAQSAFIRARSKGFKFDMPGRLQWISAAYEMIDHARRTRT